MHLYIAGPMRGIPSYNFPAFFRAEAMLIELGHVVTNPARIDREVDGFDPDAPDAISRLLPMADYMRRDLGALLMVDGIALLPGWERSVGARVEASVALALGLEVLHLDDDGRPKDLTAWWAFPSEGWQPRALDARETAQTMLRLSRSSVDDFIA